jgi:hypothetical protein
LATIRSAFDPRPCGNVFHTPITAGNRLRGVVPANSVLCRSHFARQLARGASGAAADQVPNGPESQDCQGARLDRARQPAGGPLTRSFSRAGLYSAIITFAHGRNWRQPDLPVRRRPFTAENRKHRARSKWRDCPCPGCLGRKAYSRPTAGQLSLPKQELTGGAVE